MLYELKEQTTFGTDYWTVAVYGQANGTVNVVLLQRTDTICSVSNACERLVEMAMNQIPELRRKNPLDIRWFNSYWFKTIQEAECRHIYPDEYGFRLSGRGSLTGRRRLTSFDFPLSGGLQKTFLGTWKVVGIPTWNHEIQPFHATLLRMIELDLQLSHGFTVPTAEDYAKAWNEAHGMVA